MAELKSALLLLPNLLGEFPHHQPFLPGSVDKAVESLDGLIAESATAGRRFLSRFQTKKPVNEIPIALFNEHTPDDHLEFLLEPIKKGERLGFVVDAGLPCIADPGAKLVRYARSKGMNVQAFIGPSSIMLSLMLSGLPGQHFTFNGYLNTTPEKRKLEILKLEQNSKKTGSTEIFIETPYRNKHLLDSLLETLHDDTWIAVASDLTLPTQSVISQPKALWKKGTLPNLEKKAAIFLINAGL
ncbi:MAG TPA: SAM-dependent methyltransferase [Parachlamydiaceae bacterium]|nr:SAM-dependent methyltransferase [Parachlamydiaceae bacterium]